jgi:adhesin transport system membrane fusion protein
MDKAQHGAVSDSVFGRLVKRLTPVESPDRLDWAGDADWARLQQDPLRARGLLRIVALPPCLSWLRGPHSRQIDEITRGEARVVPTTQLQIIQSVDGGVVESLVGQGRTNC